MPFPSPGDLSNSGIELTSLVSTTWQADFFFFFTADQEGSPLPSGGGSFHTDVGVQELEWQLARPLEPTLRTRFLFLPPNFTAQSKSHSVVVYVCHSYPEILTFKVMVIGAGAFRRCPGHEVGPPLVPRGNPAAMSGFRENMPSAMRDAGPHWTPNLLVP